MYHPHWVTALNIYKNSKISWDDYGRTYVPNSQDKPSIFFTRNIKISREVRQRGRFNKIGIVFNPLGVNHFIDVPLSKIAPERISPFNYFGDALVDTSSNIYKEPTIEKKRDLLDAFFINYYRGFMDIRLTTAVDIILSSESSPKTQDLAKELEISRETLLRLFKSHLCCSVEDFKSVVRFRRALDYYESTEVKPKLTHVALDNQYYDQADFIKHFKAVTGFNPKKFFSTIRNISNNGTYWTFK